MADTVLSFDPGESTGWSLWTYDEAHPMQRLEYGLIKGGLRGFVFWNTYHLGALRPDTIVCERYNPHLGGGAKNYEPLYIEGALYAITDALAMEVIWQEIGTKDQCHDSVLRENGLWVSNEDARTDPAIDWIDGRDINDSQAHALAWAKLSDHEPTIALYWPDR